MNKAAYYTLAVFILLVPYTTHSSPRRRRKKKTQAVWNRELLFAVRVPKNHERVRLALEKGADVDVRLDFSEATPLLLAAQNGDLASIRVLLQHGASIDLPDKEGRTALMEATEWGGIREGGLECVNELIAAGALLDIVDKKGDTALSIAAREGYLEIADVLLHAEKAEQDTDEPEPKKTLEKKRIAVLVGVALGGFVVLFKYLYQPKAAARHKSGSVHSYA